MGAELSNINMVKIFDEDGNECTNVKYISTLELVLKNCNNMPNKLPLHLEYDAIAADNAVTNAEYFDIDYYYIYYKGLIMGAIHKVVYIDNDLLISIDNIAHSPNIVKNVINAIKINENRKKILNNEFCPAATYKFGDL
jgi:hypothetical protein